jgi:hypothetical protein
MRNMNANDSWAETFDKDIGPFTAKYNQMTDDIGVLYANAKKGHTKGIALLVSTLLTYITRFILFYVMLTFRENKGT